MSAINQEKRVGYVFDPVMMDHVSPTEHPEAPERISKIFNHLEQVKLLRSLKPIPSGLASYSEFDCIHDQKYIQKVERFFNELKTTKAKHLTPNFSKGDIFYSSGTENAFLTAAGSTLNLIDSILDGQIDSGMAIVRPPGHHACSDKAMGFCFFNNVMLAAISALNDQRQLKVAILDWDIHHGNGTQEIIEKKKGISDNLLFISIQRHDHGMFYPGKISSPTCENIVNINISSPAYGNDTLYLDKMNTIVIPKLQNFNPDIILVSSGFDACQNDPLGEYQLTPECYGKMTEMLLNISPNVMLVLEGGYNLNEIPLCAESCLRALLNNSAKSKSLS